MSNENWLPISSAPKDGTGFIIRNADHPSFGASFCVRNVRHEYANGVGFVTHDLGGWLFAENIEPDYLEGYSVGGACSIPTIIAPDDLNTSVRYEWMPLPGVEEPKP